MVEEDKAVYVDLLNKLTAVACLSDCTASKPCIVCQFYDQVLDIISDEEEE